MSEESTVPSESDAASIDDVLAEEEPSAAESSVAPDSANATADMSGRPSALDPIGANDIAAERRPTVLVLAGAVASGKTSVYAAIYERLGRGEFGGWMFGGSRTIPGLEERCFWWRIDSENPVPAMEATRANAAPWLHLQLRDSERREPAQDLLFGDYEGELFEHIRDGIVDPNTLSFLRRADYVGVAIDGAKIADRTTRLAEHHDVLNLLKALIVPDALAAGKALFLAATKIDEFEKFNDQERRDANDALSAIQHAAASLLGFEIPMVRLAVRSHTPDFPLGHGLESLLEILLVHGAVHIVNPPTPYEPLSSLGRFRA